MNRTVEVAAQNLLAVLSRLGDFEDGCFHYRGKPSPELETPMQELADALLRRNEGIASEAERSAQIERMKRQGYLGAGWTR